MMEFLSVILLIYGILQIILFFIIWGMANDIKSIKNNIQRYYDYDRNFNKRNQYNNHFRSNEFKKDERPFEMGDFEVPF